MERDGGIQEGGLGAVTKEEMENQELMQKSWDDVTGEELDIEGQQSARKEEIQGIHRFKVHDKAPITESWGKTSKAPIQTRWIDINKGDKKNPEFRYRFVAKDFNQSKRMDLLAATPLIEALKLLMSFMMTEGIGCVA